MEELFEILEIGSPRDFSFFEQFAALAEYDSPIAEEPLIGLFAQVDKDVLAELTENYFEDILQFVPDEYPDMYTLLSLIGRSLTGLARLAEAADALDDPDALDAEDAVGTIGSDEASGSEGTVGTVESEYSDEDKVKYAEEFSRFRNWYSVESEVSCVKLADKSRLVLPVSQALTLYRVENFTGEEYKFDFSGALDYQVDEYSISLADLESSYDDYDEELDEDGYTDSNNDFVDESYGKETWRWSDYH